MPQIESWFISQESFHYSIKGKEPIMQQLEWCIGFEKSFIENSYQNFVRTLLSKVPHNKRLILPYDYILKHTVLFNLHVYWVTKINTERRVNGILEISIPKLSCLLWNFHYKKKLRAIYDRYNRAVSTLGIPGTSFINLSSVTKDTGKLVVVRDLALGTEIVRIINSQIFLFQVFKSNKH